MRLFFTAVSLTLFVAQLAADQDRRLFRGPFVANREVALVLPDRALPVDFQNSTLYMGSPAPWAALRDARLLAGVRSKTVRTISTRGIWLRVAAGPAEHGMFTFLMRGVRTTFPAPDVLRLRPDGPFELAGFATVADEAYPGLLLLNPETKLVFTLERLYDDSGAIVFENPDATELLWEALGKPSFTQ